MSERRRGCPDEPTLDRAFTDGLDRQMEEHIERCPSCAAAWSARQQLVDLGKCLPTISMTDEQRASTRAWILASVQKPAQKQGTRRWWPVAAGSLAAVAMAALVTVVWLVPGPAVRERAPVQFTKVYRATVHEGVGARYARIGSQPDEIVRLYDGLITVEVEPLQPGERFRVVTGDGEVEVRGTVFEVTAQADRLVAVAVIRGKVEVRPEREPERSLVEGERWVGETLTLAGPKGPAVSSEGAEPAAGLALVTASSGHLDGARRPTRLEATRIARGGGGAAGPAVPANRLGRGAGAAEVAWQDGWTALRTGAEDQAVAAFEQIPPDSELAEDAAYWRGVALVRSGRKAEGARAFESFLGRFPRSSRRGEAMVALGWLRLDQGDVAAARSWFQSAASEPDDRVRTAAQRGLEALGTVPVSP